MATAEGRLGVAAGSAPAQALLEQLAAGANIPVPVMLVVAHPDDETIGCGASLARFAALVLVHATDGAPRDGRDAAAHGFATTADYAAARLRELDAALAAGGVRPRARVELGLPDQEAARHVSWLARRLAALARGHDVAVLLTHAFEGGHPDHDAVAAAVHLAAALTEPERRPGIVEMPLYHAAADGGWALQGFLPDCGSPERVLRLDPAARARKRRMIEAFVTQRAVLAPMRLDEERFRLAPAYDVTRPPNGGNLLYERYGWGGMTAALWCRLAAAAVAELGLQQP